MVHRIRLFLFFIFLWTLLDHLQATNDLVVEQAIAKCRDKLAQDPTFPPAQFLLGKLLSSIPGSQNLHEIAKLSWQAGSCEDRPLEHSQRIEALIRAATTYVELGDDPSAAAAYTQALALLPDQASVEQLLHECTTLLILQLSTSASSVEFTLQLAQLATDLTTRFPQSVVTWQFQGAIARQLGQIEVAYQAYHAASSTLTKEDSLEMIAQSNILASSAARMAAKPIHVQMSYLERAYQHCTAVGGDTTESTQHLQAEILSQMGTIQKAAGNVQAAIRYFQTTLETKPGDGHALAQLASLGALPESAVQSLEADYIRDLFDGYANRFEEELVTILDYKGHVWVAEEAAAALLPKTTVMTTSGKFTIVDIGCGTGLVGDYLVQTLHLPSRLLGVDLSERMVKLAAARTRTNTGDKIYESVTSAEALDYLNQLPPGSIHGIVAADVFIYIGNLESIFQSSRRALVDSGVVVFSVELSSAEQGMVLLSSGRFGHSKEYIDGEARKAGFRVKVWKEGDLRKQRGQNVRGAVVLLEKVN